MLKEFTTRQKTVLACKIEDAGKVEKIKAGEFKYTHKGRGASTTLLIFATSPKQTPKPGDYIIQLSKDDTYLCGADVFHDKYNVKGMVIR